MSRNSSKSSASASASAGAGGGNSKAGVSNKTGGGGSKSSKPTLVQLWQDSGGEVGGTRKGTYISHCYNQEVGKFKGTLPAKLIEQEGLTNAEAQEAVFEKFKMWGAEASKLEAAADAGYLALPYYSGLNEDFESPDDDDSSLSSASHSAKSADGSFTKKRKAREVSSLQVQSAIAESSPPQDDSALSQILSTFTGFAVSPPPLPIPSEAMSLDEQNK